MEKPGVGGKKEHRNASAAIVRKVFTRGYVYLSINVQDIFWKRLTSSSAPLKNSLGSLHATRVVRVMSVY